jgi:S-adenosylmethionine decarboxylase proenzyme
MHALGRQILVEFYDCKAETLKDEGLIRDLLLEAVQRSGATIVSHDFHTFNPHGVSGAIVIAESHVTIHTWPEYHYAAADIFTCGETIDPWVIMKALEDGLEAMNVSSMELKRGLFENAVPHKPTAPSKSSKLVGTRGG